MTHRGFTLLELLVVLSIVGIATTLTVPAISRLDRDPAPTAAAADEISKLLRTTRRMAMERGTATELLIEPSRGGYQVWVEDESEGSFEGSIEFPQGVSVSGGGSNLRFTFDPLGMGRGPPITVRGFSETAIVVVAPWTGRVAEKTLPRLLGDWIVGRISDAIRCGRFAVKRIGTECPFGS